MPVNPAVLNATLEHIVTGPTAPDGSLAVLVVLFLGVAALGLLASAWFVS